MRLFIGIKTHCDNHLSVLQNTLRQNGRGSFTRIQNLHITLKFLGETPPGKIKAIQNAMDKINAKPFMLEIGGAHIFNVQALRRQKSAGTSQR